MTPNEVAAKLQHFNEWRRGHHDEQPDPRDIGEAIDAAVEMIDRLEADESDALEQARLNGRGAERELALMAKLEAAELMSLALRAKIAEMEKQEPVAEWVDSTFDQYPYLRWREPYKAIAGAKLYTKFYAIPGAKGEEK